MKKILTLVLALLLLTVVFTGCKKKEDPVDDTKVEDTDKEPTKEPTKAPEPEPTKEPVEVPALAADTRFNAFEQFDTESATGENGPWLYSFTADKGETFEPCTILEATGGLQPWHPWGGNWIGVGINADVPNLVELNTDMLDGMNGALGFKAPADGRYVITGYVINPWDQTADLLYARLNGTDLFTVQPGMAADPAVAFPVTEVELKADDVIYFFCPSTSADGWVSAYVDLNVYYEPTSVPEVVLPEAPEQAVYDAFNDFDTESATGENGPWLYYVTTDEGASFTPCTVLEAMDGLTPWHPVAGNWTGVGLNADVPDFVELNADTKGGSYGALSFKAPEDGAYTIKGLVKNPWEQDAEELHIRLNGTDIFTIEPSRGEAEAASFEINGVTLTAGEEVFFYCPSTTEGGWVSAYVSVTVVKD
ncbi:MAG: hypothetical protein EWM47_02795 [Anaerolineaceae bacterium]|nr:MAG: hypothetical protein EWM47_02795 [Anaerolineaceae bacterium]